MGFKCQGQSAIWTKLKPSLYVGLYVSCPILKFLTKKDMSVGNNHLISHVQADKDVRQLSKKKA